jgi:CrcB protein
LFYALIWIDALERSPLRIALIMILGAFGSLARYELQGFVQQRTSSTFPYGTLIVNILGCLLLGGIGQYALRHLNIPPDWRVGITVGFIGGFTTFSTFCYEGARLFEDGSWNSGSLYVVASVIGGILAVFCGMRIADRI